MEGGLYVYAIAEVGAPEELQAESIDGNGELVEALPKHDVAAIVSRCNAENYAITRSNTLAHQRVMEEAMQHWPILPVRFNTIAEERDQIVEKLLTPRYEEFCELLDLMRGKSELGLKAVWTDMEAVFQGIVDENPDIKRARSSSRSTSRSEAVRVGEMVKNALQDKKEREAGQILRRFDGLWHDRRVNDIFGDSMILNAAFLVEDGLQEEFDRCVGTLDAEMKERVRFKYVGPVPPCNFVEIVVTW